MTGNSVSKNSKIFIYIYIYITLYSLDPKLVKMTVGCELLLCLESNYRQYIRGYTFSDRKGDQDLDVPMMSRPPLFRWLMTLLYWWLPPGDGELPLNREWIASTSLIDVVVVLVLLIWCTVDWWCENSETKQRSIWTLLSISPCVSPVRLSGCYLIITGLKWKVIYDYCCFIVWKQFNS
jgi:hypothetical protein